MRQRVGDLRLPALLWLGLFLATYTRFGLTSLTKPIVKDLETSVSNYQTVLVLVALITAAAIPTSQNLGELYGQRRLVAGALLLSIVASVIGAVSSTVVGLIGGFGIIGGLAAAPLVSLPWTLTENRYQGRARDVAIMALGLAMTAGSALAPTVAGLFADTVGWRWSFVPQIAIAGAMFFLLPWASSQPSRPRESIDWLGGALALIGVAAVLTAIVLGDEYGWFEVRKPLRIFGVWEPPFSITQTLMLGGVVLLGLWVFERRTGFGRSRVQPFRVGSFRERGFVATVSASALHGLAMGGMMFALFVFVPFAFKLGGFLTSIVVLPYSIATMVAAVLAPQLDRWATPRQLLQGGLLLAALGVLVLATPIARVESPLLLVPGLLLAGLGSGLVFQQVPRLVAVSTGAAEGSDGAHEGPGISTAMQMLGGAMGTALLGALLMGSAATSLVDGVARELGAVVTPERRSEAERNLSEALRMLTTDERHQALAQFPAPVQEALVDVSHDALVHAMGVTLVAVIIFLVLGAGVAALAPRGRDPAP